MGVNKAEDIYITMSILYKPRQCLPSKNLNGLTLYQPTMANAIMSHKDLYDTRRYTLGC